MNTQTPNPRDVRILTTMARTGELSAEAAARLRREMYAGADAYPYYGASGQPDVWADNRRYAAAEYNAHAERLALAGLGELAPAIILWRLDTPGIYATDEYGRAWATFSSGAPVQCRECGAHISAGWRSPETATEAARAVCAQHVAVYGAEQPLEDPEELEEGEQ